MNKNPRKLLSDSKFYSGYSRWDYNKNRYETWEESVARVMNMHREKYDYLLCDELDEYINYAEKAYKDKLVLGSQRGLQFGGEQIFKHESKLYNCAVSYCDRLSFFRECMYLLLCGVGVGFSVQNCHIKQLPKVYKVDKSSTHYIRHTIEDSIEGWANSFDTLLTLYTSNSNYYPIFDYSKIRQKGSYISGGFKAPGPEGLKKAHGKWIELLDNFCKDYPNGRRLDSITCYDLVMHMSDAVLSGGVRRSATICLFDKDDELMCNAKTGDWFVTNPQRARSNNSVVLIRDKLSLEEFSSIMQRTKAFGEPGFVFSDTTEILYNPLNKVAA